MTFPSVTLCNHNQIRLSFMESKGWTKQEFRRTKKLDVIRQQVYKGKQIAIEKHE